jgi:ArsR family transcriptional regulator
MNADHLSNQLLMACLGDASRFRIVSALLPGPRCVTELATEVRLSQSCTTRHLQALERRGVVCGTRDGKRVLYRLRAERPELEPLLAWALSTSPAAAAPGATKVAAAHPRRGGSESAGDRAALPDPPTVSTRNGDPPGRPRPRPRSDLEDFLL